MKGSKVAPAEEEQQQKPSVSQAYDEMQQSVQKEKSQNTTLRQEMKEL